MPNSYTLPTQGADAFIQTDALNADQELRTEPLTAMAKLNNFSFAHQCTGVLVNQHFGGGVFYYSSTTQRSVLKWRLPNISQLHIQFRCSVRYRGNGTNTPQFAWRTTTESGSISTTNATDEILSSSYAYSQTLLTIGVNATGKYRTIELLIQGPVQISNVVVEQVALASPIAATNPQQVCCDNISRTWLPTSDQTFIADSPMSASKMIQIKDDTSVLQLRRRVLFAYSGLDLGYESATNPFLGTTVKPQKGLILRDFQNMVHSGIVALPFWSNPERLPLKYTIYYYVISVPFDYTFTIFDQTFSVLAGTSGWHSSTFTYNPPSYEVERYSLQNPLFKLTMLTQFTDPLGNNYEASPIQSLTLVGV